VAAEMMVDIGSTEHADARECVAAAFDAAAFEIAPFNTDVDSGGKRADKQPLQRELAEYCGSVKLAAKLIDEAKSQDWLSETDYRRYRFESHLS
jgi:hypothetical protein